MEELGVPLVEAVLRAEAPVAGPPGDPPADDGIRREE
jgi:hypothetical protein